MRRPRSLLLHLVQGSACAAILLLLACTNGAPYFGGLDRCVAEPSAEEVAHRLLLIGDAGAPGPADPVLELLTKRAALAPDSTTIVFLGDNIYERGLRTIEHDTPEQVADAHARLDAQLQAVEQSGAEGIFIPGNHDWDDGGRLGWARMQEVHRYIERVRADGVRAWLLPPAGCPGPRTRDLGAVGRLAVIDTQWWLHPHAKPGLSSPAACENLTEDAVVEGLRSAVRDSLGAGMTTVIAAHHPLESHGIHGRYLAADVHLFPFADREDSPRIPLPVIGTLYAAGRAFLSPVRQDLSHPTYRAMRRRLSDEALGSQRRPGSAPVFYVAGHDHSIQILDGGSTATLTIVSGAGSASKVSRVSHGDATRFANDRAGFVEMDLLSGGDVWLGVFEPEHRSAANECPQVFSMRVEREPHDPR